MGTGRMRRHGANGKGQLGKGYEAALDTKQAGKRSSLIETRPHDDPH